MTNKPTVMAVDDSLTALQLVEGYLAGSEFELVAMVSDVGKVMETYANTRPDVVLLDVVMPTMTGVEVLKALRAFDGQARVIMVSSLGSKEKVMECLHEGAINFIVKPVGGEKLRLALQAATQVEHQDE